MSTEEKYKDLKRKYVTLKDAVKCLHDDFGKATNELEVKKAECSTLEEQNKNLQKAYDSLTEEVSYIKTLKSSKSGGSKWENALTLIKKGSQSSSNNADNDVSILYNEIVSLKTQLEETVNEKEDLLKRNQTLKNEADAQKYEYNTGISELKERVLALEGILKDLQVKLTLSEQKATVYEEEIASLNGKLESRHRKIEKLEDILESERQSHFRYVSLLEGKLYQKLNFDLRRLPLFNAFNSYNITCRYDWSAVRNGVEFFEGSLFSSLVVLFRTWHAAFIFSQGAQIVTDTTLRDTSYKTDEERSDVPASAEATAKSANGLSSVPGPAGEYAEMIASFEDIALLNGADAAQHVNSACEKHLWKAMEFYRQKSMTTLSELIAATDEVISAGLVYKWSKFKLLVHLIRDFSRNQRIYLCIEEYLSPYKVTGTVQTNSRLKSGPRLLISCLGELAQTIAKIYTRCVCSISYLDDLAIMEVESMVTVITNELERPKGPDIQRGNNRLQTIVSKDQKTSCMDETERVNGKVQSIRNDRFGHILGDSASDKALRSFSSRYVHIMKELLIVVNKLKSAVSYRVCCPKLLGKQFFPLSGGSSKMIEFSTSIDNLESNIALITEDMILSKLKCMLKSRRDSLCLGGTASEGNANMMDNAETTGTPLGHMYTLQHVSETNTTLLNSTKRINLDNIESSMTAAEEDRRQMQLYNDQLRTLHEELMIAKTRCAALEEQLKDQDAVGSFGEKCATEIDKLVSRYKSFNHAKSGENDKAQSANSKHDLSSELHMMRESNMKNVKKLSAYVKYLVRTVGMLEDSNRLLKQSIQQHVEQYNACVRMEESNRASFNEQISLMSEHISELNASIMQAEYRVTELSNSCITCPKCKTKCSLGTFY
ncbi:hypothetical protein BgAZ_401720 [Babesia gibsoni]|uniref:Uncharacterized protein n=1 Tax=Babesia gibsoni TaxID=33632 RepID=A0AAD8PDC7_BABGI|nr:hypothetical protein BgAZ_401720 [Babesia gibsoni]